MSRPYKQAEFEIIFGEGVGKSVSNTKLNFVAPRKLKSHAWHCFLLQGCILDCAEMMDIVVKKGSWYSYGDHRFASVLLFAAPTIHYFQPLLMVPFSTGSVLSLRAWITSKSSFEEKTESLVNLYRVLWAQKKEVGNPFFFWNSNLKLLFKSGCRDYVRCWKQL